MSVALVVEDDKNSLDGYAELIRDAGFETLTARTLQDARRLLREHEIDVAILDLQLPDGTGIELLEDLSAQPDAEVVMITGHGSIDSAVEALRRGASDYLTKPVDIHRLRKILDKTRATKELAGLTKRVEGTERKLANEKFVAGASHKVVQAERDRLAKMTEQRETLVAYLAELAV